MKNENGNCTEVPVGWTSLEQSRRLDSCGLDVKSADMHWKQVSDGLGEPWVWKAFCNKDGSPQLWKGNETE